MVTAFISDDLPWLILNERSPGIYTLDIEEGALVGNETIGVHRFALILDDNNIYGPSITVYQMQIDIYPPPQTLPRFVNDTLVPDGAILVAT